MSRAVDACRTVRLDFDGVVVPDELVLSVVPYDPSGSLGTGLRLNGSLALGVGRRAVTLLGPTAGDLDDELVAVRAEPDTADAAAMPAARAAASELALRAAALGVSTGSRAVVAGEHAQRLVREAMFLLVFGSRPPIKAALLERLGGTGPR